MNTRKKLLHSGLPLLTAGAALFGATAPARVDIFPTENQWDRHH